MLNTTVVMDFDHTILISANLLLNTFIVTTRRLDMFDLRYSCNCWLKNIVGDSFSSQIKKKRQTSAYSSFSKVENQRFSL